jgi:RNA methyltransferase, TrmH family
MPLIESPQNQNIKLYRSLEIAKSRRETGLFAVEGIHAIEDLLEAGWKAQVSYWCPDLLPDETLPEALHNQSREFLVLSEKAFRAMSEVQSPQGLAATVRIPNHTLKSIATSEGVLLALHEIRDPGNMGSMIRTADASGALGVLAVDHCVDFYLPKAVRAAAGSLFHLPLVTVTSQQLTEWAKATQTALVATAVKGGEALSQFAFPPRSALLIGNEAGGVSDTLREAADHAVTIPMPGPAESLNAAVAAGIVLYEFNRQKL